MGKTYQSARPLYNLFLTPSFKDPLQNKLLSCISCTLPSGSTGKSEHRDAAYSIMALTADDTRSRRGRRVWYAAQVLDQGRHPAHAGERQGGHEALNGRAPHSVKVLYNASLSASISAKRWMPRCGKFGFPCEHWFPDVERWGFDGSMALSANWDLQHDDACLCFDFFGKVL